MPTFDGRPTIGELNPGRFTASRMAADKINQANDALRASPAYRAREASLRAAFGMAPKGGSHASTAHAGVKSHAADVKGGGGGHGGNPNHDEHGRFA